MEEKLTFSSLAKLSSVFVHTKNEKLIAQFDSRLIIGSKIHTFSPTKTFLLNLASALRMLVRWTDDLTQS